MNQRDKDIAAAWSAMSWALIVVLLTTLLIVSAVPWIVREATTLLAGR